VEGKALIYWREGHLAESYGTINPFICNGCFQITKGVRKKIIDAISEFWWGTDDQGKKMH
jgi:hypothetical protein